jgi:hypothetical protein
MLTGRANYRAAGGALGVDLEGNPGLAMKPNVGFRIAAWYWTGRGLNDLADRRDDGFKEITYRINGGYNGYTDRLEKYNRAKAVLGVDKRRSRRIKCNFVAVGELDSRIAHQAAAILNKHGIRATVTVDDGVKVLGDVFADEPLGARQMIVVGRPALDALTAEARKFALYPPDLSRTDFVSAAGKSYERTIRRTAESLALYDESGAAGRRLLRELEDALEESQGRDGAEPAEVPDRASASDAYREHATPRRAREAPVLPFRRNRGFLRGRSLRGRDAGAAGTVRRRPRRRAARRSAGARRAGKAEERRQEPRSCPQPGHMVADGCPAGGPGRGLRAPARHPGSGIGGATRRGRPGDARVARGVRRGEAEREAAREGGRRGITSERRAALRRVPGSGPPLPGAP